MMKPLGIFVVVFFLMVPLSANAAMSKPFEVSGWIPYWRSATGTADALTHLDTFTEINPFVYTVKRDGSLVDNGKLHEEPWLTLRAEAKKKNIRFVPTITWGSGETIHAILSNKKARIALEDAIAALVKSEGFDGVDIDFEGKKAATKDYFSTFLKGLAIRMRKSWIMCTIEARTPAADRYHGTTPPVDATLYANDFKAINKYCDRVRLMAYDQQGVDVKLAAKAASSTELYAPVADLVWVEKVVNLAVKDISKKKLVIGVPTYGYEYNVTAYAGEYVYDPLWTFNPSYALANAVQYGITPYRTGWGELAVSYASSTRASTSTISGIATAHAARDFANTHNSHLTFRLMVWSDAQAVADKVALAKRLGVRGVAIFKIDGGEDPDIWNVLR